MVGQPGLWRLAALPQYFIFSCCLLPFLSFPSSLSAWQSEYSVPGTRYSVLRSRLDEVMQQAIARRQLPGAVILVAHRGQIVFRRAYGFRSRQPKETPMTVDTLFDLASLTKPIATATSLMILVERGKVQVGDRVAAYLPAFGQNGKEKITIEHLLLHTSGLLADNPVADYSDGRARALERIYQLAPSTPPGTRFTYSDVNYIVLGELVEHLAGMPLDQFARQNIFEPLGMTETGFRPGGKLAERAAPTQEREGHWMIGEVHDPRSYLLGGVAGHAGLFSTADDVAIYAQMILRGGAYQGRRILSPLAVRTMTAPRPVPGGLRAYGWDVHTSFSSNRGDLFPKGESFGHTGFTGTSLWIDPTSDTAVIFLSNRVHPDGKSDVKRLRGQVATLVAASIVDAPWRSGHHPPLTTHHSPTLTGIDVLVKEGFARLKGRRVGLVTNHTGRDREGRSTIDLLHEAQGVKLVALFSPEHGIRGAMEEKVADARDEKTGLPIYSLYGTRRKPTPETLKGIDTLVYDIQDAGCRFYTYISTLGYLLEVAGQSRGWMTQPLRMVVLDRPNPIGGVAVDGPVLDCGRESFVAFHSLPVRHGMTVGELARLFNAERKLGADLEVVRMEGWQRSDFYDRTSLPWINPSPNLRSLTEALLYPGIGLLETTNVSVGRGTDRPFEWVGAPWIDGRKLAAALAQESLPGVRFAPLWLTPVASTYRRESCGGVQFIVDDWSQFRPLATGLALACTLRRLYPDQWQIDRFNSLLGNQATWEAVKRGESWPAIEKMWNEDLARFRSVRNRYLLYSPE
jgi:uncharacterized protein YbbC (DUF1343 family)/CubicO group peptidase (beta-lactamase class C family)